MITGKPAEDVIRAAVITAALSLLKTPYRWDGKDPVRDSGLDCSGFAQACLRAGGIVMPEENADSLWRSLPILGNGEAPRAGDLAFYGATGHARHVVILLGTDGTAVIGANGGGPPADGETPDAYAARMAHLQAGVRIEDWRHGGARYRADFLGYRRLPWERAAPR